jgi:2-succinyl-5-enolpyruvyl-6-hydroxy-3-cyclohexene-1-carboxylate synthase
MTTSEELTTMQVEAAEDRVVIEQRKRDEWRDRFLEQQRHAQNVLRRHNIMLRYSEGHYEDTIETVLKARNELSKIIRRFDKWIDKAEKVTPWLAANQPIDEESQP